MQERAETEREQGRVCDSCGYPLPMADGSAECDCGGRSADARLRSERDKLVKAVEERIEEFEEAAERLHEGYGRDDLPGTRLHQHGRRVVYEEVAISLRDALEAVEGDGEASQTDVAEREAMERYERDVSKAIEEQRRSTAPQDADAEGPEDLLTVFNRIASPAFIGADDVDQLKEDIALIEVVLRWIRNLPDDEDLERAREIIEDRSEVQEQIERLNETVARRLRTDPEADDREGLVEAIDEALTDLDLALDEPCLCGELEPGCPFCDKVSSAKRKFRSVRDRLQEAGDEKAD